MKRKRSVAAAAALAAGLTLASATTATVATASSATTSSATSALSKEADDYGTQSWTAYVLVGHQEGFRQVTADFKVPTVTCTSAQSKASFWIGLDGYGNGTVEQVGITTDCDQSYPNYGEFYEMWPNNPQYPFRVNPGDSIAMSVTYDSGHWNLAEKDLTQPTEKFNLPLTCPSGKVCENMTAEAVLEAASGTHLSKFTTTGFTEFQAVDSSGAKVGLKANGAVWGLAKLLMTGTDGQPLADLSTITDNGEVFSFTYKQAS